MNPLELRQAAKQLSQNGAIRAYFRVCSDAQAVKAGPILRRALRIELNRTLRAIKDIDKFLRDF